MGHNNDNPYISFATHYDHPPAHNNGPGTINTALNIVNRTNRAIERACKQAETFVDNLWDHIRLSPSPVGAAMHRYVQGARTMAHGGHKQLFQHVFGQLEGEKLIEEYACYVSSPDGPIIGTLYISSKRLAFYSSRPTSYVPGLYLPKFIQCKAVVPLDQLIKVTQSVNRLNPSEKHIEVLIKDGHKLYFLGFLNYERALKTINETLYQYHNHSGQNQGASDGPLQVIGY